MTCIVGIELNGKVIVGGDSAGVSGMDITARSDSKVFKLGSAIFGFTSSFRMGQILRYKLSIPIQKVDQDDYDFLCTDFIDAVIRTLESNGYSKIKENEKIGGTFIVAYKNKIYVVYEDFQVAHPLMGYCAVGCGADYAIGAITALLKSSKDGLLIAQHALEIAAQHSAGVCAPFLVLSGDDK